jgi:hypothetical protein
MHKAAEVPERQKRKCHVAANSSALPFARKVERFDP